MTMIVRHHVSVVGFDNRRSIRVYGGSHKAVCESERNDFAMGGVCIKSMTLLGRARTDLWGIPGIMEVEYEDN